jgi:hypothetical protein
MGTDQPEHFDPELLAKIDQDPVQRESDRGCVLLLTADIENCLKALLEGWFSEVSDLSEEERRPLYAYTGPLGSLASKIALAQATGLLPRSICQDLHRVRKLRNLAAHSDADFSLSDPTLLTVIQSMEHEHAKTTKVKRYSLASHGQTDGADAGVGKPPEAVMKGRGFVRFDKANFHLTALTLQFEIGKHAAAARIVGQRVPKLLSAMRTAIEKEVRTK